MSPINRLAGVLLPRSRPGRLMALGASVDSVGTGMFFASAILYFVGVVGIPATRVALVATVAGLVALATQTPIGRLADRFGPGRVYLAVVVLRGLGYMAYALVDGYPAYLVLTVALTTLDRTSWLQQSLVAEAIGDADRTRTMASIRAIRNVGLSVGFLAASVVVALNERLAFVALFLFNGASFFVFAAVVWRIAASARARRSTGAGQAAAPMAADTAAPVDQATVRPPLRSPWFLLFTVANGVLSLYDTVLIVLLPLWVLARGDVPASVVPVLLTVNTVLTVALQVPAARFAGGVAASRRLVTVAMLALVGCCLLFAGAELVVSTPVVLTAVVFAVVLLTVAENLHSAAGWELSHEMSPAAARSRYLAAFSLGMTSQKIAGPSLLAALVLPLHTAGWAALAVTFALAAVAVRVSVARGLPAPVAVLPVPA